MAYTNQQLINYQGDLVRLREWLHDYLTLVPPASALTIGTPTSGGNVDTGAHLYAYTFVSANGESQLSPLASVVISSNKTVPISAIAKGPTGTTARKVYRSTAAAPHVMRLLATISNNTATTISDDTVADSTIASNAVAPSPKSLFIVDQYVRQSSFWGKENSVEEWVYYSSDKSLTVSVGKARDIGLFVRLSQNPERVS